MKQLLQVLQTKLLYTIFDLIHLHNLKLQAPTQRVVYLKLSLKFTIDIWLDIAIDFSLLLSLNSFFNLTKNNCNDKNTQLATLYFLVTLSLVKCIHFDQTYTLQQSVLFEKSVCSLSKIPEYVSMTHSLIDVLWTSSSIISIVTNAQNGLRYASIHIFVV